MQRHVRVDAIPDEANARSIFAFQVHDFDISLGRLAQVIQGCAGVEDVRGRRPFSGPFVVTDDVKRQFEYLGRRYMIVVSPIDTTGLMVVPYDDGPTILKQSMHQPVVDLTPLVSAVRAQPVNKWRRMLMRALALDF